MFVLCCIWFIVAFLWITITSALDKEWMIDGRGINNVCDVLMFSGSLCGEKNAAGLCTPPRWLFSATGCGSFFCAISFVCEPDWFIRHTNLQTSRLTTFARRRQRSPRLFTVEAFQTHLEGREWHIDTVGMEASQNQLVDLMA